MATKYICDKCHREFDVRIGNIIVVEMPQFNQYNQRDVDAFPNKKYDLCVNCLRQINDFMKPDPIVNQK